MNFFLCGFVKPRVYHVFIKSSESCSINYVSDKFVPAILDREYFSASVFFPMPCFDIPFETHRMRMVDRLKTAFVTSFLTKTTFMHDPYL